jgi:O-antigen ligase
MALLQAVVIGLIAFIIAPGYFFYFDVTPKAIVLLAGTATALFCAAFIGSGGVRTLRFTSLLLLAAASLGVSTALSTNPALSLFGANWRRFGAVAQWATLLFAWLVAAHTAGRPDRARVILRGVSAAGLVTAIYGIAQYFGWDPLLPAAAYHIGEGIWTIVRPPGTLGHASYFATWLVFVIFLGLALAASETGAFWRRLAFTAAALALVAMLLTGTRAAILGLLAGCAVWLYWRGFRLTRRLLALAAAILMAGAVFYYSPAGWQLRSRARWSAEDPWGGARLILWRDSLRMGLNRLPAGYGPEVFTAAFPRFESRELARAYPDFAHESPHNMFLDALVAQGIPGLLILCGLCVAGFAAARRLRARQSAMAACLAAALAAGIVSQQFTVFTIPTAVIFYTTLALAIGLAAEPAAPRRRIPFAVGAVLAALALFYAAARITVAGHALALAQRSLESGQLQEAAAQYSRYDRWRFPGASADLWYSRALMVVAQKAPSPLVQLQVLAQSGAAALRATRTAEDPFNAWYSLAALCASQNDAVGAERSLRAAVAANPNWFKPHWTLAQVLLVEGRMEDARREAALAAELNAGKNPEVDRTLEEIRARGR